MGNTTMSVRRDPEITIGSCSGDLAIEGREQASVTLSSDGSPNLEHDETRGVTIADCEDDLSLSVPLGARVRVGTAEGDLRVSDVSALETELVSGDARLERVTGMCGLGHAESDLHVRGVGRLEVGDIDGDLLVESAGEGCRVGEVGGDARIRDTPDATLRSVGGDLEVNGALVLAVGDIGGDARIRGSGSISVEEVGGDLRLDATEDATASIGDVGGDAQLRGVLPTSRSMRIGGDLQLDAAPLPGEEHAFEVGGDASLRLPTSPSLRLDAVVDGEIGGLGPEVAEGGAVSVVWGSGDSVLRLHVGGDLRVSGAGSSDSGQFTMATSSGGWQRAEPVASGGSATISAAPPPAASGDPSAVPGTDSAAQGERDPQLAVLEAVAQGEMSPEEAEGILSGRRDR